MAAITCNAAHLKTVLAAFREILDAFVSNRMRRAVAQAEHILPRRPGRTIAIDKRAMIAVPLTSHDLSPQQNPERSTAEIAREGEHSGLSSAAAPATVAAQFRPLDPGIVNETIPAFFIGRNMEGFWVARDANGQIGGIFLLKELRSFVCEKEQPADRVRNHISIREDRTRPR